ncbi:putative holin protein [Rhizobium phage RHph_TM3_3_9]|nr:putative holin protein [Rhizobium phage RHph_TM3_3_9]QIG67834.1 hypothetical protein EVB53_032 [Rhizobium phage RHph_Y60]QIG68549.1 hypothetical protein EVB66_028 [Rhizobium phage RHph_TM3_3_13]QIG73340.1 hypothetical protein EVC03_032 [Rhizobium phage RHph_Y5A]QIG74407.1 hypothetical protein EVC09_027 [Rhizobium phage RHph_TM3_3_10]QIG75264.1 hypothetical protein EVC16_035 [Rhizobium phage RHph_Y21]QIG75474.1 hypothetical protein EVC18_032 [Rhizobium phage RHph_Y2_4]QIG76736.1 hypothetic
MSDQLLYDIVGKLGAMGSQLENIKEMSEKQALHAENQAAAIAKLTNRTDSLEKEFATAKPFIDKAKQWEQRGIGVIATVSAVGAIFGGVIIGLREKILHAIGIT